MRMPDFGITTPVEPLYVFGTMPHLRRARFMVSMEQRTCKQPPVIFIQRWPRSERKNRCRGLHRGMNLEAKYNN